MSRASSAAPLRFAAQVIHGHTLRLLRFEKGRARQFELADLITVPSPPAVDRYRRLARRYRPGLEEKIRLMPHAVAPWFVYTGAPKEPRIAAAGRWQDLHQKRPDLLVAALTLFLRTHPDWQADIFGAAEGLSFPADITARIVLHGRRPSREVAACLDRASILFCPSAYESFHIASAEALCCGASVVGVDSGMTATHRWFVSENSGSLAAHLDASALADALSKEAAHWEQGHRQPREIATVWQRRLYARFVAAALLADLAAL